MKKYSFQTIGLNPLNNGIYRIANVGFNPKINLISALLYNTNNQEKVPSVVMINYEENN